jgi:uncharacterized protein (DUF58 family)
MTRYRSERLELYAILSSIALVTAIAASQPGLVAFAAPFALALVLGLIGARSRFPSVAATITAEPQEVTEGDRVVIEVELTADEHVGRCDVGIAVPAHFRVLEGDTRRSVTLRGGVSFKMSIVCATQRWGSYVFGPVALRSRDPGGLFTWEGAAGGGATTVVRVLPRREQLRHLVRSWQVGSSAGEQLSRLRGEGLELADIRRYVPGDRARSINWRVSGRLRKLHVNDQHPDRNTDVVLFLDTFAEPGLSDTVRIAWGLADAYLGRRDRVGLIGFGGVMSWVEPAGGQRQRERLTEALEDTVTFRSYAWKSIEVIPARALPARCLVLALSPLLDERIQLAVATLRARGLDVAIIEVPTTLPGNIAATWSGAGALRLYEMEREMMRDRFVAHGIAVVRWDPASGTEGCILQLDAFRRQLRVALR